MTARYLIGDVFDRLADIEPGSVDLVMTSPPFLALRSYLPADHPDKHREIGSETDPAEFVDTLLRLTAEFDRVLAPHGSIAVELGDTYASSGGVTDNRESSLGGNDQAPRSRRGGGRGWPLAKSLALIPELYRVGLAYGINPITGTESPAGRWRVRNVVRWHRTNPPVGALGDKYRPATSDLVVACRSDKRWFDLDAVRTELKVPEAATAAGARPAGSLNSGNAGYHTPEGKSAMSNPAGAPPLDTWIIPTQPYKGSHYATYPMELCRVPILSMCPAEVCVTCGEPRRRLVDVDGLSGVDFLGKHNDRTVVLHGKRPPMPDIKRTTLGWSECDCTDRTYRPGVVLDPFAGSGTTLAAAIGHGRHAIGIDIDERNADLARERVGMFLTVETAA